MASKQSFGSFIIKKRMEIQMTAREFSKRINLSAVYICDIEKDRRAAPRAEILDRMANALSLSGKDRDEFYDLAAESKNIVSEDLPEYIMKNNEVRQALRMSKDLDIDMKMWQDFMAQMRNREKTNQQP